MKNATASLVNIITLLVGIIIGILVSPRLEKSVSAQQKLQAPICVSSATVECVSPIMTVGSAGIGSLLSNKIATDQLTVNGYDILKLQNNILGVLLQTHTVTPLQARAIADSSHPDKQLRFLPPAPPSTPPMK